jgi:hypothetical protein
LQKISFFNRYKQLSRLRGEKSRLPPQTHTGH